MSEKGHLGNVLVTSAGRKAPLVRSISEALKRVTLDGRVIAGDSNPLCPIRFLSPDFWWMPELRDLSAVEMANELCKRGIQTVIPTRDGELAYWAEARAPLKESDITVVVSDREAVDLCLDKLEFATWGAAEGFPVIPASLNRHDFAGRQLVVKERFGSASKGVIMNVSGATAELRSGEIGRPIFQPYEVGEEISVDAFMTNENEVHGLVLRRRVTVAHGESHVTTTFRDQVIERELERVLSSLKLRGAVVLQAIVNDSGLHIIEVNPRFGGASTASIAVGLDLCGWSLSSREGYPAKLSSFRRSPQEVTQVRYAEDKISYGSRF